MTVSEELSAVSAQKQHAVLQQMERTMPSMEDAEEFNCKVDEIAMLVDGLAKGTISPEYIDSKYAAKAAKEAEAEERAKASRQPLKAAPEERDSSKDEELKAKVREIQARLEWKKRARAKYDAYIAEHGPEAVATDYLKWDLWCPEDEEDELLASCTPDNPQFRAMEKDINDRHRRVLEQRQIAERARVAGNAAFKAGQWTCAYSHYSTGLEAQRTNAALHANAAMASLKMGCYVQAIEHCDRVVRILQFLLEKPHDPLLTKALVRRATARCALRQYREAIQDLTEASSLQPEDPEVARQLAKAQREHDEAKALQKLEALRGGAAADGAAVSLEQLRSLETATAALRLKREATQKPSLGFSPLPARKANSARCDEAAQAAERLRRDIAQHEELRLYFRECGGLGAAAEQLCAAAQIGQLRTATDDVLAATPAQRKRVAAACALLLSEACQNDANLALLAGRSGAAASAARLPGAAVTGAQVLEAGCRMLEGAAAPEAALLLYTLSTDGAARAAVSTALACVDNSAKPARTGAQRLLEGLGAASAAHQLNALSLLSNCVMHRGVRDALKGGPGPIPQLCGMLQRCRGASAAAIEKTATLVGNAATDAEWRAQLAAEPDVVRNLIAHAAELQAQPAALQACLGCLFNLAGEAAAHEPLLTAAWLKTCNALLASRDSVTVVRTAGIVARVARAQHACAVVQSSGTLSALWAAARSALAAASVTADDAQLQARWTASAGSAAEWSAADAWAVADSLLRVLAIWGGPTAISGDASVLRGADVHTFLLFVCSCSAAPVGAAGNAALCITYLADDEHQRKLLASTAAVKLLTNVAYTRKNSQASRNAGIALAKLAQEPSCHEQLRECHGFEIIYNYVRP